MTTMFHYFLFILFLLFIDRLNAQNTTTMSRCQALDCSNQNYAPGTANWCECCDRGKDSVLF
jgi:hypothetical protein